MIRSNTWVVLSALSLSAAACSTTPTGGGGTPTADVVTPTDTTTPTDATSPTDNGAPTDNASPADVTRTDATPTDAPRTDAAVVDAGPPYDPCAASAVIDLNMRGTTTANVTRYTGNNNMAGAMAPLPSTCASGRAGHQVVLRYTPRTTARLRVSTNNMGTDAALDTVAWAQATCALPMGDAGVTSLGCNDDNGSMPRTNASTFTTEAPVMMGTTIYIVVAGYTPHLTDRTEQGTFELAVTELITVPVGMACDATGVMNACAMGSRCVTSGTTSTCVADGAAGGNCRSGMGVMPCDTGLMCSSTSSGTCYRSIAMGGACVMGDPSQRCATGTVCAPMGTGFTCQVSSSIAGMPCNDTAPLCGTGLTCDGTDSDGVCRSAGTAGGMCNITANSVACPMNTACLASSLTAATCAMTRPETEPNNSAMMPQAAITASTAFTGNVGAAPAGDGGVSDAGAGDARDCYAVTVPANGTIVAATEVPGHPGCGGADTVLTLTSSTGTEVAMNDDDPSGHRGYCSYISARMLAAGTYSLCVAPYSASMSITGYTLSIGVFGP